MRIVPLPCAAGRPRASTNTPPACTTNHRTQTARLKTATSTGPATSSPILERLVARWDVGTVRASCARSRGPIGPQAPTRTTPDRRSWRERPMPGLVVRRPSYYHPASPILAKDTTRRAARRSTNEDDGWEAPVRPALPVVLLRRSRRGNGPLELLARPYQTVARPLGMTARGPACPPVWVRGISTATGRALQQHPAPGEPCYLRGRS